MENKKDYKVYDDLNQLTLSGKVIKEVTTFGKDNKFAKFTMVSKGKFIDVVTFKEFATNLWLETITKDAQIVVVGKVSAEQYDKKDGSGKALNLTLVPEINGVTLLKSENLPNFEDINRVSLVGGITTDTPSKFMRDGKECYGFTVATNVLGKTVYFKVETQSTISVAVASTLSNVKGRKVLIQGIIDKDIYTKDNKSFESAIIKADMISSVLSKTKTTDFNSNTSQDFSSTFEPQGFSGGFEEFDPSGFSPVDSFAIADDDIPF